MLLSTFLHQISSYLCEFIFLEYTVLSYLYVLLTIIYIATSELKNINLCGYDFRVQAVQAKLCMLDSVVGQGYDHRGVSFYGRGFESSYRLFKCDGSAVGPQKTPRPQINPFPIPLMKGLFSADKVEVEIILITTLLVQTNKQTNDYRV